MTRRGPVDPRLARLSAPARRWIAVAALLAALRVIGVLAFGVLAGTTAAAIIAGDGGVADHSAHLAGLAAIAVARAAVAWAEARFGRRAGAEVVADLRARTLARLAAADPRNVDRARWRTLLGEGIEGVGPYIAGYLPALASTVIATPAALAAVWWLDAGSALIALVTLPLIPIFMWLVGTLTAGRTARRLRDLGLLSDQMLDLVAGLPTLRAFGRQRAPAEEIRRLSDAHRTSTMSVLRIAFLSGFVLEFLATLSVALVAVGIGFRLIDGGMTLAAGLTVLIIVPEVYGPVREVGVRFHDAQDGLAAIDEVFSLDDGPAAPRSAPQVDHARPDAGIRVTFDRLTAAGRDGDRPRDLSGVAEPGAITVLAGGNGSGKSTALLALLGIVVDGVTGTAAAVGPDGPLVGEDLWRRTSYVPQRPVLDAALVGDASGLSLGERQRVAVGAELLRGRELLVLDEPTAHLDEGNAAEMMALLRRRADEGATVLLASHDPVALAAADVVVEVAR
ncbi:ABC transporter ATP-binding protein/permease [Corynebacterium hansenii]|uniref:ABC transporter ATP-binding protein/permease n=1 Tax=Corynebacterium hansenii TaxID=394964 RepID=A0ABV7ZQE6_9CORY|nr:ABC transporter transmembrane domain-containing protein [Corynebacterium hansenii]WJZ00916.1 ATP-binding/permease protein CydD [Corynebacterium hansenii]